MFFPNRVEEKEDTTTSPEDETTSAGGLNTTPADMKPHPPWIKAKSSTDLVLNWPATVPPRGVKAKLFSVQMNGVSVYSGPKTEVFVPGLDPNRCYRFRTSAFMPDGTGWTQLSTPLEVNNCGSKPITNPNINLETQSTSNPETETQTTFNPETDTQTTFNPEVGSNSTKFIHDAKHTPAQSSIRKGFSNIGTFIYRTRVK